MSLFIAAKLLLWSGLLGVAVWQTVEVLHHSPLFADFRSIVQARPGWKWLDCPWCLSIHVGLLYALLVMGGADWYMGELWIGTLVECWIVGLVSSRVANFLNDITHRIGRTPK